MTVCAEYTSLIKRGSHSRTTLSGARRHLHSCPVCTHEGAVRVLVDAAIGPRAERDSAVMARIGLSSLIGKALAPHPTLSTESI